MRISPRCPSPRRECRGRIEAACKFLRQHNRTALKPLGVSGPFLLRVSAKHGFYTSRKRQRRFDTVADASGCVGDATMIVVMQAGASQAANRSRDRADRVAGAAQPCHRRHRAHRHRRPGRETRRCQASPGNRRGGGKSGPDPRALQDGQHRGQEGAHRRHGPAAQGRRNGHRRHRRAVFRRKPSADPGNRPRGPRSGSRRPARRRVQAAHQSVQLPGAQGEGAGTAGRGPRRDRVWPSSRR